MKAKKAVTQDKLFEIVAGHLKNKFGTVAGENEITVETVSFSALSNTVRGNAQSATLKMKVSYADNETEISLNMEALKGIIKTHYLNQEDVGHVGRITPRFGMRAENEYSDPLERFDVEVTLAL